GAFLLALGILLFLVNVLLSLRRGALAGPNPWDAPSLEWATPSPPPYNFAVIPSVASRHPLWEKRLQENAGETLLDRGMALTDGHETLGVTPMDSEPDIILKMPEETYAPVLLAGCITVFFCALLARVWWLAAAAVAVGTAITLYWMWPRAKIGQTRSTSHV
ncbi:MAG: cytochrome ubiquinol oxidase subunit I, partial [Alphaproteobacteria bacterium]|nr:cytochrome ubiquinol oxidase subunit I [Alphaproteobacteria bacterium]